MKSETTQTEQTPPASEARDGQGPSAYLVTIAGLRVGEMFKLAKEETVLGRSDDVDLRLMDEGISRRHATVRLDGERAILTDLGSANGTFCNGARISDARVLSDGDKISMGGATILKFTYQDALDEQVARRLYESAVHDGLTGLYNRRAFDERLRAELAFANRHSKPLALLIADIDHFKRINDEHGHPFGDQVLREVARRLATTTRAEDVLARFGGEEFIILCRETDGNEATALADRMRSVVAAELRPDGGPSIRVTISVGLALSSGADALDEADLIKGADAALYEAKRRGRDRGVVFVHGSPMVELVERRDA
jgi:two-component system, cell cycle response regulator